MFSSNDKLMFEKLNPIRALAFFLSGYYKLLIPFQINS